MEKTLSRSELTKRLVSAEADIKMLTALLHVSRTQIAYLEYVRESGGWAYDPTLGYTRPSAWPKVGFPTSTGLLASTLARGANEFHVPPLYSLFTHILRDSRLDVKDA